MEIPNSSSGIDLAKIESQIRCVSDYELPILATSIGLEPTELLKEGAGQALQKGAVQGLNQPKTGL